MWNDWKATDTGGDTSSNAEYFRALKRANQTDSVAKAGVTNPSSTSQTRPEGDRRRHPRYKCEGSVRFDTEGSDVHTWATLTDFSRSGCYVEAQATSPVDTEMNMRIEILGIRMQVKGVVRVSYPFLGMGIAFKEIPESEQARLEEILQRLSGETSPLSGAKPGSMGIEHLSGIEDPGAALMAIAAFFKSAGTLSRETFEDLVARSQKTKRQQTLVP